MMASGWRLEGEEMMIGVSVKKRNHRINQHSRRAYHEAEHDLQAMSYDDRDESRGRRSFRSLPPSQSGSISPRSDGDGMDVDSHSRSRPPGRDTRSMSRHERSRSYERSRSPYERERSPLSEPRYLSRSISRSDRGRSVTPKKGDILQTRLS
ncbi:hypothetical protein FRC02_004097 [Tulasnella sp. 418]|nr:hypothetical protein FRC02_004097 [Tulasnella sp. 418]